MCSCFLRNCTSTGGITDCPFLVDFMKPDTDTYNWVIQAYTRAESYDRYISWILAAFSFYISLVVLFCCFVSFENIVSVAWLGKADASIITKEMRKQLH